MPKKTGRPCKYTKEIGFEICKRLAEGESLSQICRDEHIPPRGTVLRWIYDDEHLAPGFYDSYMRARKVQAFCYFDDILEISDNAKNDWMEKETKNGNIVIVPDHEHINRSRLRVDSRKWVICKMLPEIFGDDKPKGGDDKNKELPIPQLVPFETKENE